MNQSILAFRLAAQLLILLAVPSALLAQTGSSSGYPSKPVRVIVPYQSGGAVDILARQTAKELAQLWGQAVLVENRPGSSTIGATEAVAKSPADGYTLLMTTDSTMSINPHLFAKLPYDPDKDFAPITQLILMRLLLVAHSSVSANNLTELIAQAKAKPGVLNYASYGNGSQPHLAMEMLKSKADINIVHVPYKSAPGAILAALAGEVQLATSSIPTVQSHITSGRLKVLAIGGTKRSPLMPDVHTFAEQGYPEVNAHAWYGLFAPAGSPREVISRIHRDVVRIITEPGFRDREITGKGFDLVANSPEEFAVFLHQDRLNYGAAVKSSGVRAE